MIYGKEKVEKIYNYLSSLANAHKSSKHKYCGWSLYDKRDKKKGFFVQSYKWDKDDFYKFYLVDVDFNYDKFFSQDRNMERIYIDIRINSYLNELEIKQVTVKGDANLVEFFTKLDNVLDGYTDVENLLTQILLSKVEGE